MNNTEDNDLNAIKAIKSTLPINDESNLLDSFEDKGLSGERSLLHLEFELKVKITNQDLNHKNIELCVKIGLAVFILCIIVFLLWKLNSTLTFITCNFETYKQPLDDSKLISKVFLYLVIATFISVFSLIAVLIKSFTVKPSQPTKEEASLTPSAIIELINNVLKK